MNARITITSVFLCLNFAISSQTDWKTLAESPEFSINEVCETFELERSLGLFEDEEKEYKEFMRWFFEWRLKVESTESDNLDNASTYSGVVEEYFTQPPCPGGGKGSWENLIEYDFDSHLGRIFAMHPVNGDLDVLLCGSDQASGIFRSTDGGQSWSNMTDVLGLPNLGVRQFLAHPSDPNLIFAAVGNSNLLSLTYGVTGSGLLFTTDGGLTWKMLSSLQMEHDKVIRRMVWGVNEPNIMYAVNGEQILEYDLDLDQAHLYGGQEPGNSNAWQIEDIDESAGISLGWNEDYHDIVVVDVSGLYDRIYLSSRTHSTSHKNNGRLLTGSTIDNLIVVQGLFTTESMTTENVTFDGDFEGGQVQSLDPIGWTTETVGNSQVMGHDPNFVDPENNSLSVSSAALETINYDELVDVGLTLDMHVAAESRIEIYVHIPGSGYPDWDELVFSSTELHGGSFASSSNVYLFESIQISDDELEQIFQYYWSTEQIASGDIGDHLEAQLKVKYILGPNHVYTADADFSDLVWVDNVNTNHGIFYSRIDIEKGPNESIFALCRSPRLSQARVEKRVGSNVWQFEFDASGATGGSYWNTIYRASESTGDHLIGGIRLRLFPGNGDPAFDIWSQGPNNLHADIRAIEFVDSPNGEVYLVGSDGGPNVWDPQMSQWIFLDNPSLNITQFYALDVDETTRRIVGGTLDNSVHVFDGQTWSKEGACDAGKCLINEAEPDVVYWWSNCSFYSTANFFVSTQTDNQWIFGWAEHGQDWVIEPYHGTGAEFMIAWKDLRYFDEGVIQDANGTFHDIQVPGENDTYNGGAMYRNHIEAIAVAESDPDVIYIADYKRISGDLSNVKLVFLKTEHGLNTLESDWIDLSDPAVVGANNLLRIAYQHFGIRDIEVNPTNPDELWVCFPGVVVLGENEDVHSRVLHSIDGGYTWTDVSAGLPPLPIHQIQYQKFSNDLIYCATDVGVFYKDASMSEWECFSNGLPVATVTDLEIDYCENKLYCATFGRGIWKSDLLPTYLEIDQNTTWTGVQEVDQNIIIRPGNQLTINGELHMGTDKGIFIEEDAKLLVDGGTITRQCDLHWKGIEVWGDATEDQEEEIGYVSQGEFEMINGGKLEYADIGVMTYNSDDPGTEWWDTNSGGIVKIDNAILKDCKTGVLFRPYFGNHTDEQGQPLEWDEIPNNLSYIRDCHFYWTDDSYDEGGVECHVFASGIKGLEISGCTFENNALLGSGDVKIRGIGVRSNSTSFIIDYLDVDGSGTFTPADKKNYFNDLYYGVWGDTFSKMITGAVAHSEFDLCYGGVRLDGLDYSAIVYNEFSIDQPTPGNEPIERPFGVYMHHCENYELEENDFSSPIAHNNEGMVINDCGPHANEIYRNSFNSLGFGIIVMGDNWDEALFGLQMKCNEFGNTSKNKMDIALTGDDVTINQLQGSSGSITAPAGNRFSHDGGTTTSDFYIQPGFAVDYFHHDIDANENLTERLIPIYHTTPDLEPTNSEDNWPGVFDQACPSDVQYSLQSNSNDLIQLISDKWADRDIVEDIYYGQLDGGDPRALENFINDPNNDSWAVRNEMISASPYVSDNAFRFAIFRTPPMNDWHIAQVLLENSPLSPAVQLMVNQAGLDPYYQELVNGAQNGGFSSRTLLEAELSELNREIESLKSDYLRKYLLGLDENATRLEVENLLQDTTESSNQFWIDLRTHEGDVQGALELLGICAQGGADTYCEVQSIAVLANNGSFGPPGLSASDIALLESVASEDTTEGSARARSMLYALNGMTWPETVLYPTENRMLESIDFPTSDISVVRIFPNPANASVFMQIDPHIELEGLTVEVIDIQGRIILRERLSSSVSEWDVTHWSNGLYISRVYWDEHILSTAKFEILH